MKTMHPIEGERIWTLPPTLPVGPERARPRAQQAPTGIPRQSRRKRRTLRPLLRPGTGALRRECQDAPIEGGVHFRKATIAILAIFLGLTLSSLAATVGGK